MSNRFKVSAALAASAALIGSLTLGTLSASAGTNPQITVTPSTGLTNGQTVTVTGSGWTPNEQVYLVECTRNTVSDTGCNIADNVPITVTSNGTFSGTVTFKVFVGTAGNGTCGTSTTLDNCELSVGNIAQTESATMNISFAGASSTTTTAAPATTTTTMKSSGTMTTTTKPKAKTKTITCVKGKVTKKVTGVKPTCPSGYKLK